jgi:hypothetical protein
MTNRFHRVLVGAFLAALAASAPGAARAEEAPHDTLALGPVPVAEARMIVGTGIGWEAAGSLADHRVRLEGGLHGWRGGGIGEAAALVRVLGEPTSALWLRGGYMFQALDAGCGMTDAAWTLDAGLAYRKRWSGRSLFFAEGGVERLTRADGVFCNDSGLGSGDSAGARLSVGGQFALSRFIGVYARAGIRTAEHVREIGFLPELWLGLAFEI